MGRAIDLGCHEGYPGHHVYNMLLERELARGPGLGRIYGLSALFAAELHRRGLGQLRRSSSPFPGDERLAFERRVLYPLAGLPAEGAATYLALQDAIRELAGARFTIARDLLEGRITREQAIALTQRYSLDVAARAPSSRSPSPTNIALM